MPPRPIYYDTETTGVKHDKDRIIEIAAFDPERGRSFVQLVNPEIPIPPESTAISQITNEMVASAPLFGEVAKEFLSFCEGEVVLIAHNNDAFDKKFLEKEFKRVSVELPEFLYIDSLKWARKYRPDLPRHSLQFLREVYMIEANQAHRALDDVIVLHKVFSSLIDDLSMDTVLSLLAQESSSKVSHMPFGKHQGKPLAEVPKDYITWLESSGAFAKNENQFLKESFVQLGLLKK